MSKNNQDSFKNKNFKFSGINFDRLNTDESFNSKEKSRYDERAMRIRNNMESDESLREHMTNEFERDPDERKKAFDIIKKRSRDDLEALDESHKNKLIDSYMKSTRIPYAKKGGKTRIKKKKNSTRRKKRRTKRQIRKYRNRKSSKK